MRLVPAVALLVTAMPARAQLANASAAATAMAGNYTAMARSFNAAAWNPANLGLPGNSSFSVSILPFAVGVGAGPITPALLSEFGCGKSLLKFYEACDTVLPDAAKREWVALVNAEGSQSIQGDVGVTFAALSFGRVGVQASTGVFATGSISPALVEILLFGNAGYNNGVAKDYSLSGSSIDASVLTTIGLSYAQPLSLKLGPLPNQTFSVGATAKYILGSGLVTGEESGGSITANPIRVHINFPMLMSQHPDSGLFSGSGVGLDVGAAWQGGPLKVGAAIRNLVSTFSWDTGKLEYRPLLVVFTPDSSEATKDAQAYAAAPQALKDRVSELKLKPSLAVGAAFSGFGPLTLSGEFRQQLGDGLALGAKSHVGVGAELRLIPFIPIRAGFAAVTGGTRLAGGFGLEFGIINLQLGAAVAKLRGGDDAQLGMTLGFGGR